MDINKLAETIVKSIEDSTCDIDSIETVKELLEKYYPKPEDSKPDEKGTQYLLKRAGTMEMNTIGIYSTKKEVFDEVTNRFGTLTDYDDNIIANFDELVESDTLWEMYEMEIEVI